MGVEGRTGWRAPGERRTGRTERREGGESGEGGEPGRSNRWRAESGESESTPAAAADGWRGRTRGDAARRRGARGGTRTRPSDGTAVGRGRGRVRPYRESVEPSVLTRDNRYICDSPERRRCHAALRSRREDGQRERVRPLSRRCRVRPATLRGRGRHRRRGPGFGSLRSRTRRCWTRTPPVRRI